MVFWKIKVIAAAFFNASENWPTFSFVCEPDSWQLVRGVIYFALTSISLFFFLFFLTHVALGARLFSLRRCDARTQKSGPIDAFAPLKKRFNYPVWKIAKSSDLKKKRGGIRMMRQSGQIVLFVAGQSNLTVHFWKQQQQQQFCPFFRPCCSCKSFKLASHDFE